MKTKRKTAGAGLFAGRTAAGICALALLLGAVSIRSQASRTAAAKPFQKASDKEAFSASLSGAAAGSASADTAFTVSFSATDGTLQEFSATDSTLQESAAVVSDGRLDGGVEIILPSAGISYALSVEKSSLKDVEDSLLQSGRIEERKQARKRNVSISVIDAWKPSVTDESSLILETRLTPVQQKEKDIVTHAASSGMVTTDEATRLSASAVTLISSTRQAREDALAALCAAEQAANESVAWTPDSDQHSNQQQESQTQATEERNLVVAQVNSYSYVNVRNAPSLDAEIIGKLYSNGVGTVVESANEDGWIKIKSGNVTGFVKMDHVATGKHAEELADEVGHKQAVIKTTTLRVRASNSTESDVISLIGMGAELDIIEEADGWYKVRTDDGEGYISADFADVEVIYPVAESREEEARKLAEAEKAAEAAAKKAASEAESSNTEKAAPAPTISKGQEVVNFAMQYLGNPYVWGGSSLTRGTDCSGFTMAVYAHFGVNLPHYDGAQRSCGVAVSSLSQAQPGDLICYYGHVGIYIGDGKIVHASNPRTGITTQNANYRQIAAIRRIF